MYLRNTVYPRNYRVSEELPCIRGITVNPRNYRVSEELPCIRGITMYPRNYRVSIWINGFDLWDTRRSMQDKTPITNSLNSFSNNTRRSINFRQGFQPICFTSREMEPSGLCGRCNCTSASFPIWELHRPQINQYNRTLRLSISLVLLHRRMPI